MARIQTVSYKKRRFNSQPLENDIFILALLEHICASFGTALNPAVGTVLDAFLSFSFHFSCCGFRVSLLLSLNLFQTEELFPVCAVIDE